MNRHPFIRFFISSTFVDMDIERNIIRNVLSKLKNEYELIGWQIETIDLRWGISQEASTDNKTMRICLNELRLCQELSPKPNFIILLGERYGWIPLPEVIPYRDMQEIQEIASKEESFLLNKWYRLDENALPTGEYIIERRDLDGIELKEYIEKVEIPLHELFVKYASHLKDESHKIIYERSATEQEIQQGALNVSDAEKHIFAYFRKLSNIPDNKEHIYRSNGPKAQFEKRALDRIRQQLINKLDRNNIYIENNLDYHLYTSPAFIDKFSNEIETHLRKIIQQEIDCNQKDDLEYEISEHIAFARKEAEHFYGREGELQFLRQYIDNTPLWCSLGYCASEFPPPPRRINYDKRR